MAVPPPPSSSPISNEKLGYYFVVFDLALVIALLLILVAVVMGCCTWLRRQLLLVFEMHGCRRTRTELQHWIPAFKYQRNEEEVIGEEGEVLPECVVCLLSFDEGVEVRQLPSCKHLFHADCIDIWLNLHNNCPICRIRVFPMSSHSVDRSA